MESLSNCMIVLEIKSLALLNTSQEYVEPCVLFLNGRTRSQAKCTLNWVVWTSRSYIISFILQQVQCQWGQKLLECFLCECRNKITLNHAWCKTYTTVKTQVPAWVFGVQATETYVGKLNRPTCARFLKQLYKVQQPFCRVIENNAMALRQRNVCIINHVCHIGLALVLRVQFYFHRPWRNERTTYRQFCDGWIRIYRRNYLLVLKCTHKLSASMQRAECGLFDLNKCLWKVRAIRSPASHPRSVQTYTDGWTCNNSPVPTADELCSTRAAPFTRHARRLVTWQSWIAHWSITAVTCIVPANEVSNSARVIDY